MAAEKTKSDYETAQLNKMYVIQEQGLYLPAILWLKEITEDTWSGPLMVFSRSTPVDDRPDPKRNPFKFLESGKITTAYQIIKLSDFQEEWRVFFILKSIETEMV